MRVGLKRRGFEVGRQAHMQHVRGLFRRTERLRIGRAERHRARIEAVPDARLGDDPLQRRDVQPRQAAQIGQRRHVHQRQARQPRLRDLVQQRAQAGVGILRLLHREDHKIVAGNIHVFRHAGVHRPRQIAGQDRPVRVLALQLDTDFGALFVDQRRRRIAADQRHIMPRHQAFGAEQRAVGRPEDENSKGHDLSPHQSNLAKCCASTFSRLVPMGPEIMRNRPVGLGKIVSNAVLVVRYSSFPTSFGSIVATKVRMVASSASLISIGAMGEGRAGSSGSVTPSITVIAAWGGSA